MKKVVVISGGGSGLGKVTAKILVKDYNVVILSPVKSELKQTTKELGCDSCVCDIRSYKQCERAIARVIKKYGRIDCLINNAGIYALGPLDKMDPKQIHSVIETNTLGTILLTRAALPYIKKRKKGGVILNVISQAGLQHKAGRTIYSSSKWALTGFTRSLRVELAPKNIKVMGIFPGKMKTGLFKHANVKKDLSHAIDPEETAKAIAFMISQEGPVTIPELSITHIQD